MTSAAAAAAVAGARVSTNGSSPSSARFSSNMAQAWPPLTWCCALAMNSSSSAIWAARSRFTASNFGTEFSCSDARPAWKPSRYPSPPSTGSRMSAPPKRPMSPARRWSTSRCADV
ncbi:hypothetical protein Mx8p74 [Myxococcus phage Mx8]|uniref:p73 n=1 Tax=Myxococcus phage Mx8 TaxID=49964 RepID=Q94MP5_9CAUD|nr:hypothetical protein Mx8p74 [Myxococcus phage Mx8]AAK94408.1 p73 [Myxococcus phage Mx8]